MVFMLTSLLQIAHVRSGTISIDLVDGDSHLRARLDRRDLVSCESVLGVLSNIDVSSQLGSATLVNNVGLDLGISNDRGILLTWTDACAVSCNSIVDLRWMSAL